MRYLDGIPNSSAIRLDFRVATGCFRYRPMNVRVAQRPSESDYRLPLLLNFIVGISTGV